MVSIATVLPHKERASRSQVNVPMNNSQRRKIGADWTNLAMFEN